MPARSRWRSAAAPIDDRLPDWLAPLPDAGSSAPPTRWAIEERGIPGAELMERAGAGLAALLPSRAPEGRVVVVCGKGNNGGDGLVGGPAAARAGPRRRRAAARRPRRAAAATPGPTSSACPGPVRDPFAAVELEGAAAIVDAILGTGFSGEPREPAAAAIEAINAAGRAAPWCSPAMFPAASTPPPARSRDPPSAPPPPPPSTPRKPGLWIAPGKDHAGDGRGDRHRDPRRRAGDPRGRA